MSCAQTPQSTDESTSDINSQSDNGITTNDLGKYKTALYAMKNNDHPKAESLLLEVIASYPQVAGPYVNLGIIYYTNKRYAKSIDVLSTALKLNPANAYAHNTIALNYQIQGDFASAEKHFLLAINNKQYYAIAHYNLALLYDIFFHKINESITHYQLYLKILQSYGGTDKKTTDWLEQLKNSTKQG
jgi:tetratricopeptide (TPR) repeat protein